MKQKLFLDFDNTIADSISSICQYYNLNYYKEKGFKPANSHLINKYDFSDQCALLNGDKKKIKDIFASDEFFEYLVPFPYVKDVLDKWKDKYEYIVITIGTPKNIRKKSMWLDKNLPIIKERIYIENNHCTMDKSIVKMKSYNGYPNIFIDDNESCLFTSDADIRIAMGDIKEWNSNWNGLRCLNWLEVDKLLDRLCIK